MHSVRNDALTVLFKVSSLITITRSISGILLLLLLLKEVGNARLGESD